MCGLHMVSISLLKNCPKPLPPSFIQEAASFNTPPEHGAQGSDFTEFAPFRCWFWQKSYFPGRRAEPGQICARPQKSAPTSPSNRAIPRPGRERSGLAGLRIVSSAVAHHEAASMPPKRDCKR